MILLDTNVVSEVMRREPATAVLEWFGRQTASELYLSAVGEWPSCRTPGGELAWRERSTR